jgi:hypothetical protein
MPAPQAVLRWQDIVKATLSRLNYQALDYRLVLAVIWQE